MTRDKHQAEQVVAKVVFDAGVEIRYGHLLGLQMPGYLLVFACQELVSTEKVNCATLGDGHQPRARVIRDTRIGPLFKRYD